MMAAVMSGIERKRLLTIDGGEILLYVIHPYLRSWPSAPSCFIACMLMLAGCAGFNPIPLEQLPAGLSIETQSHGNLKVKVAIPSNKDAEAIYGVNQSGRETDPAGLVGGE